MRLRKVLKFCVFLFLEMSGKEKRRPGWDVRPPGWEPEKKRMNEDFSETAKSSESDNFSEATDSSEIDNFSEEESGMSEKEFSKWVSMKWNLLAFDESKAVTERKQEFDKFIEQFNRIVEVRSLSSKQKLTALKIQAGVYLNDVIDTMKETQEAQYDDVVKFLRDYFNQGCDTQQQRAKFRDIKMKEDESFLDFYLRLEKQLKYCDYAKQQANEELADALIRRSVLVIARQLRAMMPTLQTDVFAIIKQGTHFDNMRKEDEEGKQSEVQREVEKPVMAVRKEGYSKPQQRYTPYHRN